MTTILRPATRRSVQASGFRFALISAAAFGLSGPMAASLLRTGWSPAAVVLIRLGGAALLLAVPFVLALRREGRPAKRHSARVIAYGLVAVAGAQLCFFSAVSRLSVGVALLLEYLAPVILIGYHWVRRGRRPHRVVLIGAATAMVGMVLVLDLFGGLRLDPIGVLFALGAACCLAGYFELAAGNSDQPGVSPMMMTAGGLAVGTVVIGLAGLVGVLPMAGTTVAVTMAGATLPWWLPLLVLAVVCAAFAYLTGILAVRRLGSGLASFVGLTEVIFAVVFAALLVSQQLTVPQLVGGAAVLLGIVLVQRGQSAEGRREAGIPTTVDEPDPSAQRTG